MLPIDDLLAGAAAHRARTGRPLVTLSYAQSLDGCIALERGHPTAISGPESLRMTHQLRAAQDAVLVGVGTVLADNPRLTVRLAAGADPRPVVLDPGLRIPLDAALLQERTREPWIVAAPGADAEKCRRLESLGARVWEAQVDRQGWIDLDSLLDLLGQRGVERLMVEGGARVIASFLQEGQVDLLVLTIAPVFLGGLHALDGPGSAREATARLENPGWERAGDDWIVWGQIQGGRP